MRGKPLNVLSLDGGGVRGLSSLLILRSLMERLERQSKATQPLLPCEVFDLICGTSTGGLIALMLGRLRMSVDEAIHCYLDFSRQVFEGKSTGSAMYNASDLEKWVKEIVGGDGSASLEDPLASEGQCCHTFVVAVTRAYADAPPKLFRSYPTKARPADSCKIWEAARATTAASPFFHPIKIGVPPQTFIDGSLSGANNPSRLAVEEAREVFGRPVECFLSLGTGVPDVISMRGDLQKIQEACHKLITSCETVHNAVGREFRLNATGVDANRYFRFSVDRGVGNIALDEWKRLEELTGVTDAYLRFDVEEERAEKCVRVLEARAAGIRSQREEAEEGLTCGYISISKEILSHRHYVRMTA